MFEKINISASSFSTKYPTNSQILFGYVLAIFLYRHSDTGSFQIFTSIIFFLVNHTVCLDFVLRIRNKYLTGDQKTFLFSGGPKKL